jgi:hypothetical protein
MKFSWPKSLIRSSRVPYRKLASTRRAKPIQLRLEYLEDRCVPSASTIVAAQTFTTGTNVPAAVSFQLDKSGNVWEFNPTLAIAGSNPNLTQISTSQTGLWSSIAAVAGADGNPALFAVSRTDGSLWEHSLVFGDKKASGATATEANPDTNWRQISNGNFMEVSATVAATVDVNHNPTGVNAVVFGIVGDGTLWEHNIGFGDKTGTSAVSEGDLNLNWRQLSTGHFSEIAAADVFLPTRTQNSGETGVPTNPLTLFPANPIVFGVIAGSGNVWEHNANAGVFMTTPAPEGAMDVNWAMISTDNFTALAAAVDPTVTTGANPTLGPGRPVLYGVMAANGHVWEHSTAFSAGALSEGTTDANAAVISTTATSAVSATIDIEPAAGMAPLTANPILFAAAQGSGNLSEHNDLFDPANGEFVTDANWAKISTGTIEQFSATLNATSTGGTPAVFAIPTDFNLWEHLLGAGSAEQTTDANWSRLSSGVSFAGAALAPLPPAPASTSSPLISLVLPPLDINLLGLEVQTSGPIKVNVSAQPGAGELLGNLLTDASNLLNIQGVNNALNTVLGSVVSLVNSASLSVTGVSGSDAGLLNAAAVTTPILDLFVAPVHLNLLGALVDTSPIHVTITAHSGAGLVLGNVVADLANLFNPPLPNTLDLNFINSKLVQLLGELNQQIPGVGGTPTPTPTTAPAGSEQIVSLAVPPINLNLLGLVLKTSLIQVNANAQTGNGDLLGNVLTTLLNTLGATPQNLSALSGNLNALLSKVVGVLNASALTLPSNAVSSLSGVLQQLALPNLVNATGTASAPILNLSIASTDGSTPPVNVNLLGLQVTTSNIQAQLLAQTGDGQILGNLLYNVANLLNPGGSISLLTILGSLGL